MEQLETAVELVLLDPDIQAGLLRGNPVEHPKYKGRRIHRIHRFIVDINN